MPKRLSLLHKGCCASIACKTLSLSSARSGLASTGSLPLPCRCKNVSGTRCVKNVSTYTIARCNVSSVSDIALCCSAIQSTSCCRIATLQRLNEFKRVVSLSKLLNLPPPIHVAKSPQRPRTSAFDHEHPTTPITIDDASHHPPNPHSRIRRRRFEFKRLRARSLVSNHALEILPIHHVRAPTRSPSPVPAPVVLP